MTFVGRWLLGRWLSPDGLDRHVIRGGALAVGAQAGRTVVQIGFTAILARLLVPEDFGLIAIAAGIVGIGSVIAELGLTMVTIQRREIDDELSSGFFYANLLAGVAVALAIAGSAPIVAGIFGEPRLQGVMQVLAGTIPLVAACRQPFALLQRAMRWHAVQTINSVPPLLSGIVAVGLASVGFDASALVAQAWVSALLTFALCWHFVRWRPGPVSDWRALLRPLRDGLSLSAFSLANCVTGQADDLLLGWRWGTAALGLYGRAQMLIMLPAQMVVTPVSSALIPALSRLQDDHDRFARLYLRGLTSAMIVAGASSALFIALAQPIVSVVLGPQWNAAVPILRILGFSILPLAAMNAAGWLYIANGQAGRLSRWALCTLPVWICGFVIALPFGPTAIAIAYGVVAALLAPANLYHASRAAPVAHFPLACASLAPTAVSLACGLFGHVAYVRFTTGMALVDLCLFGGAIAICFLAAVGGLWSLLRPTRRGFARGSSRRARHGATPRRLCKGRQR